MPCNKETLCCVIPCAFVLTAYITISCMHQFTNIRLAKYGIRHALDYGIILLNYYIFAFLIETHDTSWWQPMGKDTQAFSRLFHAIWMLSCDCTYL